MASALPRMAGIAPDKTEALCALLRSNELSELALGHGRTVLLHAETMCDIEGRVLACLASLAAGVNFLPWTGPTLRASTALHISTADLFRPLVPVQAVGLAFVFGTAWMLGRREEVIQVEWSSHPALALQTKDASKREFISQPRTIA